MMLTDVAAALSEATSDDDVFAVIRSKGRALVGCEGISFILRDQEQTFYADEEAIGPLFKGKRFAISACVGGWAMLHGKAAVVENVATDSRVPAGAYETTFVKSLVIVPLRSGREISSAIGFYWATQRHFDEGDLDLMRAFATIVASTLHNLSLRRALEQRVSERTALLSTLNTTLESFAAALAHDMRGLLAVITANASELRRCVTSADQVEIVTDLDDASRRLVAMSEGLIKLHRPHHALSVSRVNLSRLAHELVASLRLRFSAPITADIEPDMFFDVDEMAFTSILGNLLENSWKFLARRGHGTVWVKREAHTFIVEDDGPGLPPATRDALFQPFVRLDNTEGLDGHGLGLSIAQRLVEKHRGTIRAEDRPLGGARFVVTLPTETPRASWAAGTALS